MPLAIIFGNEANGIDKDVLSEVQNRVKINMEGNIESLNVAMSVGIIGFEIKRRLINEK